MIETLIARVNDALYSFVLVVLLLAGGLYFTLRTGGAQFRLLREQFKILTQRSRKGQGISSFHALMVSTASRVGTGNIIGVSTALCLGGFGSVFWMWVIALIGSASALVESTLAQIYKRRGRDGCYGGPACYIETGLGNKRLAVVFTVLLIITYGFGFNMLTSYNLQSTFAQYSFYRPDSSPWVVGLLLAAAVYFCLAGSGKRILRVTGVLVPVMGGAYVLVALLIVVLNIQTLPGVLARIVQEAFDFKAIFSGFSGSCVMYGIKRGLLSNEAGVGSAPNASAAARVDHPVQQGLAQVLSVFLDTLVICTATAFMCMCSGVEPSPALSGAPYVQAALRATLGSFGPLFMTAVMLLFGFTTLLGNLYYMDQCIYYLLGKAPGHRLRKGCHRTACGVILLGAGLSADLLWSIADLTMGAMVLINMPVILWLSGQAIQALRHYEKWRKKEGPLTFFARDIALPHQTDYWR